MEEFVKQYTSPKILTLLNRCRLYIQAITLSDITSSTGTTLCNFALKGVKHPNRPSTYTWPSQKKIHSKYWSTWRSALAHTFCGSNKTQLQTKFGPWTTNNPNTGNPSRTTKEHYISNKRTKPTTNIPYNTVDTTYIIIVEKDLPLPSPTQLTNYLLQAPLPSLGFTTNQQNPFQTQMPLQHPLYPQTYK